MEKKVFSVILIILTIFLVSILAIFNYQNYSQRANDIKRNLMRMDNGENGPNKEILDKGQQNKYISISESGIKEQYSNENLSKLVEKSVLISKWRC